MDKEMRERALFELIRVDNGISTVSADVIDERAKAQWMETHDRFPTLEEIDRVIEEVRNGG